MSSLFIRNKNENVPAAISVFMGEINPNMTLQQAANFSEGIDIRVIDMTNTTMGTMPAIVYYISTMTILYHSPMRWICVYCNTIMDKTNFTDFRRESDNDEQQPGSGSKLP